MLRQLCHCGWLSRSRSASPLHPLGLLSAPSTECDRVVRRYLASSAAEALGAAEASGSDSDGTVLEATLRRMREALGLDTEARRCREVQVSGHGTHLGTDVKWSLRFRPDGAFVEQIVGTHLSFRWGYDGGASSPSWEVDNSGIVKTLEFDDHENLLLSAWVRSGAWLQPAQQQHLDIQLLPSSQEEVDIEMLMTGVAMAPDRGADPAGFSGRTSSSSSSSGGGGSSHWRQSSSSSSSSGEASTSGAAEWDGRSDVWLLLKLKNGRMPAKVRVDPRTWQPLGLSTPQCGDTEVWQYAAWHRWPDGLLYPAETSHIAYAGGMHRYIVTESQLLPAAPNPLPTYCIPPNPPMPEDTDFDTSMPSTVPAWMSRSGHLLVELEIEGRTPGYVVLDTGASGFVIESKVAEELQLQEFGELYVASVCGKIKSCFRVPKWVRLGPLTIRNPTMMAVPLGTMVKGAPGPVVGIVGYDILRRVTVQLPAMRAASSSSRAAKMSLGGYSGRPTSGGGGGGGSSGWQPAVAGTKAGAGAHAAAVSGGSVAAAGARGQAYELLVLEASATTADWEDPHAWDWLPLRMVANLPHVEATFQTADGRQHTALFMLDSGAAGADVMFHSRATHDLDLLAGRQPGYTTTVRGVGGDDSATTRACSGQLPWLQLGATRFENIKCLFALQGGLDISLYSSGFFCADLVARSTVVVDYSRKRLGIRRAPPAEAA